MPREDDSGSLIRRADDAYASFTDFAAWRRVSFDGVLWDDARLLLDRERGEASTEDLAAAIAVPLRAAAITTGAVEDLYSADRGFTFTVAARHGDWESELAERGPHVRRYFEAQLAALELVVDVATRRVPITETWIRELHAQICREQRTYRVVTSIGVQERELTKGAYKVHANHVRLADGSIHAYSPVDRTPDEMHRLVVQLSSSEFADAHPVLQAAYAHHSLVAIHPFVDGNGRVARALASVFTYRAASVPLVVYPEDKLGYFDALSAADRGSFAPLVALVLNAAVDTMNQLAGDLRRARSRRGSDAVREISELYRSASGDVPGELAAAASRVATILRDEVRRQQDELDLPPEVTMSVELLRNGSGAPRDPERWRQLEDRSTLVLVEAHADSPDLTTVARLGLGVVVARDAEASAPIRIERLTGDVDALAIRMDHVTPFPRTIFRSILESWVAIQLDGLLRELRDRVSIRLHAAPR